MKYTTATCLLYLAFQLFVPSASGQTVTIANSGKTPKPSVTTALSRCADIQLTPELLAATKPTLFAGETSVAGTLDTLSTIQTPVKDAKPMYFPLTEYPQQPYLKCGILDITAAPFNADKTGTVDATQAIQEAVDAASLYNLVIYFPLGTYKITDTIQCIQPLYWRSNGNVAGGMRGACYFMGDQTTDGQRPQIVLPPNTPGFTDRQNPKTLIKIWARGSKNGKRTENSNSSQPSINMNNYFVGIDIAVGAGNFGTYALSHAAAQGSVIEDVRISIGDGSRGISGAPGSGGSTTNVHIDGGEIGLALLPDKSESNGNASRGPSVTGLTLTNQRKFAITFGFIDAFTMNGVKISMAPKATGPAIEVPYGTARPNSNISLINSTVEFSEFSHANSAISSRAAVYIKNSYFKNTPIIFRTDNNNPGLNTTVLEGEHQPDQWFGLNEFAYGRPIMGTAEDGRTYTQTQNIFINGSVLDSYLKIKDIPSLGPGPYIQSRHLWTKYFSKFNDPKAVNVKAQPYFAKGDGIADDTAALQLAIDQNEIIFLPKGYYKISRTLELKSETKIIGLGAISSIIGDPNADAFQKSAQANPLMRTIDSATANNQLSFFELFVSSRAAKMFALNWRAGGKSIIRDLSFTRQSDVGFGKQGDLGRQPLNGPLLLINGNGGGKIYNFHANLASQIVPQYRHILIDGISGPLSFYHLNIEGGKGEAMTEIRNSKNIFIYQVKIEGSYVPIWIKDSENIKIYSNSGNGYSIGFKYLYPEDFAQYTPSFYRIERSRGVTMANLTTTNYIACDGAEPHEVGCGVKPDEWYMLFESTNSGQQIITPALERPVLYKTEPLIKTQTPGSNSSQESEFE
jgi:hypothetical protein